MKINFLVKIVLIISSAYSFCVNPLIETKLQNTNEAQTCKVFFPAKGMVDSLFLLDDKNNPTGYYDELFDEISRCSSLKFEFFTPDVTTEQEVGEILQDIIINGSSNKYGVSIIPNLSFSTSLQTYIDYTDNYDCKSPLYLITQVDDKDIVEFETSTFENKTIGLWRSSTSRNKLLIEYLTNSNLYNEDDVENSKVQLKYYETKEDRDQAFYHKDVNFVIGAEDLNDNSYRTVDTVGYITSYTGVIKGNDDILNRLNNAYKELQGIDSTFFNDLTNKYFPTKYSAVVLNQTEKDYLKSLKKISIGVSDEYFPFLYTENDEYTGILSDYFKKIKSIIDIDYEFVITENAKDSVAKMLDGSIDLWWGRKFVLNNLEDKFVETRTYANVVSCLVANKSSYIRTSDKPVGITYFDTTTDEYPENYVGYTKISKLITDLNSGELGYGIVNKDYYNYAKYTLRNDNIISTGEYYNRDLHFSTLSENTILHGIINKCIRYMNQNEIDNILLNYQNKFNITYTTLDWINDNIDTFSIIVSTVLIVLISVLVVMIFIIVDRRRKNDMLRNYSETDFLTGLKNKKCFNDFALGYLEEKRKFTLMMLDIDNFKSINDLYGHVVGDEVIKQISHSILELKDPLLHVFRFGGDEYVMIYDENDYQKVNALCKKIIKYVNHKININKDLSIRCSCCLGASSYPYDALNLNKLLALADSAMYYVKERGKDNYEIFDPSKSYSTQSQSQIENEISEAIEKGEVYMVFQPQVDLVSGKTLSFESLMRINNSKFGPAQFIPAAEKSGLIIPLGKIAIRQSVEFLYRLKSLGFEGYKVSINLSAAQMSDETLYSELKGYLKKYDIESEQIIIEMTESAFFSKDAKLTELLNNLKKDHIELALDDFGSGYSSINNLTKYYFNTIKFDKGIIDKMFENNNVANLVKLVHDLGYSVLAEGVETEKQVKYLRTLKCDMIQGYYFSKPLAFDDVVKYLKID